MPSKLRVLCIHGFGQAGQAFRAKTGGLRSESKKLADWHFADAPHLLTQEALAQRRAETGRPDMGSETDPCNQMPRAWWSSEGSLEDSIVSLQQLWEVNPVHLDAADEPCRWRDRSMECSGSRKGPVW